MKNTVNMSFASSLTNLCEINSSFDMGILRICYTGQNRNGSYFSRKDIERNIKTIFNCPIVTNYDIETESLGGHDMKVVRDANNEVRIINVTEPVGVIPESSKTWFSVEDDEFGVSHEYLYAEVLLWKRQAAYSKIKRDGITSHSMEVTVKNGETVDGVYHIHDFEFTAFALLGDDVTPCYESSALEVFSANEFKKSMSEMMQDLKDSYSSIDARRGAEDKNNTYTEGGEEVLDEKIKLVEQYGFSVEELEFSIEEFSIEELTEKFEAMKAAKEEENKFALVSNIMEEIHRALDSRKVACEWGECNRYVFIDCDIEASEVYCWDRNDWLMYGFTYKVNGDAVEIDFECKKRKKYVIADFEEGESQESPFADAYALIADEYKKMAEDKAKFEADLSAANQMNEKFSGELTELREYKSNVELAALNAQKEEVFAKFESLNGVEAFEALRAEAEKYSVEEIEDRCFAIKGRIADEVEKNSKFSLEGYNPKLPVDKSAGCGKAEPYRGIFAKYGY